MSVNSELSALLTKMGGTPLESDSNSDLIKKISNAYEGGGGGSSGGGVMILHEIAEYITIDGINTYVRRLDKTYDEIQAAFMAGTTVLYVGDSQDGSEWIRTGVNALGDRIVIFEYDTMEETVSGITYEVSDDCLYPYHEADAPI